MKNLVKFRSAAFYVAPNHNFKMEWYEVHQKRNGEFVVASFIGRDPSHGRPSAFAQRYGIELRGRPCSLPKSATVIATETRPVRALQYIVDFEVDAIACKTKFVADMGLVDDGVYDGAPHYMGLVEEDYFGSICFHPFLREASAEYAEQLRRSLILNGELARVERIAEGYYRRLPAYL